MATASKFTFQATDAAREEILLRMALTGPTGSGKTTTLYTSLAWVSATNAGGLSRGCELNMMTVEDPVEYDL